MKFESPKNFQPRVIPKEEFLSQFRALSDAEMEELETDKKPVSREKSSKELTAQIKETREILGEKEVLGPEAVKKSFGIELDPKKIPAIPFSREELLRAKELGQFLVLRVKETADGQLLTMQKMHELKGKEFIVSGKGKLFYSDDGNGNIENDAWYKNDPIFTQDTAELEWALVSKEPVSNSTNANYLDQTVEIVNCIKNKVFKGMNIPQNYQEAIDEFEKAKSSINLLMSSDWQQAAQKLESLKITQLTRQSPAEVLYDIIMYRENNGEKILENTYAWTKRRDSGGDLVGVGDADADGARVGRWGPGRSFGNLGVFLSRSR